MTIIELDNNNIMSQRGVVLLVLIFLTVVGQKSVYIKASGDDFMQYSDGTCLGTWTKPMLRSRWQQKTVCECQTGYIAESVSCRGSNLSDGPHIEINLGFCMTFDKENNVNYLGKCP